MLNVIHLNKIHHGTYFQTLTYKCAHQTNKCVVQVNEDKNRMFRPSPIVLNEDTHEPEGKTTIK